MLGTNHVLENSQKLPRRVVQPPGASMLTHGWVRTVRTAQDLHNADIQWAERGVGRGDDAPSRRRPKSHNPRGVGSGKFAFESHMSGSHLACQECGCWLVSLQAASPRDNPISGPAEGSLELNLALPQRNSDSWASCYRQTRPKTSICGTQQQTPTTTANLSNFLLQGSARSPA